jgi:heme/copper-type cytochrome/quinol oxidase subunit 3
MPHHDRRLIPTGFDCQVDLRALCVSAVKECLCFQFIASDIGKRPIWLYTLDVTTTRSHPVPRRANSIGMLLFLASLGMLFAASMLGYVLIRVTNTDVAYGTIKLPNTLWVSTVLMLAGSVTIHQALMAIRRERRDAFKTWLTATIVFASLFVVVQTPAMIQLYNQHSESMDQWRTQQTETLIERPAASATYEDERYGTRSMPFFALVMVLILVHALHVVGGLVALGMVVYGARKEKYDHEHYAGVQNCVLYWHFLDVVWIIMFTVIAAFG